MNSVLSIVMVFNGLIPAFYFFGRRDSSNNCNWKHSCGYLDMRCALPPTMELPCILTVCFGTIVFKRTYPLSMLQSLGDLKRAEIDKSKQQVITEDNRKKAADERKAEREAADAAALEAADDAVREKINEMNRVSEESVAPAESGETSWEEVS